MVNVVVAVLAVAAYTVEIVNGIQIPAQDIDVLVGIKVLSLIHILTEKMN